MITHCFLYKAARRGSEAGSSEKRCREERERGREPEPEREPERRSESLMRTGDRNRSCEREVGIADANEEIGIADANGDGIGDRIEGREAGNEEEPEAEGDTAREGDKAPYLTNVIFQNTGCCVPIYSRGLRRPLYAQDRPTTQISTTVPPSSRSVHSTRTLPRYPQSVPL